MIFRQSFFIGVFLALSSSGNVVLAQSPAGQQNRDIEANQTVLDGWNRAKVNIAKRLREAREQEDATKEGTIAHHESALRSDLARYSTGVLEARGKIAEFSRNHPDLIEVSFWERRRLNETDKRNRAIYEGMQNELKGIEEDIEKTSEELGRTLTRSEANQRRIEGLETNLEQANIEISTVAPTLSSLTEERTRAQVNAHNALAIIKGRRISSEFLRRDLRDIQSGLQLSDLEVSILKGRIQQELNNSFLGEYIRRREANMLVQVCERAFQCTRPGTINQANRNNIKEIIKAVDEVTNSDSGGDILK